MREINPLSVCAGLRNAPIFKTYIAHQFFLERAEIYAVQEFNLALREVWIIIAASEGNMSQGVIADCLGVNRNVMVHEIDRLEKKGHLKRVRNTANRREQIIALTPKGKQLMVKIAEKREPIMKEIMRPMGSGKIAAWVGLAGEFIDNVCPPPKKQK